MVKVKIREVIKIFLHSLDLLLFNSFLIKSEFMNVLLSGFLIFTSLNFLLF